MARCGTPRHGVVLAVLACLTASCGSEPPSRSSEKAIEVDVRPKPSALVFEPAELHLGRVVPGGFVDGTARVRNAGERPVKVIDFNAPCECTSAEPSLPRSLGPGESFSFPVRLDLGRLLRGGLSEEGGEEPELVRRTLSLWTADGRSAQLPLVVELSEQLLVEPSVTRLRGLLKGSPSSATVTLSPGRERPGQPVGLLSIEPVEGPVPLSVEQRRLGEAVELEISLGPFPEAGPVEAELRVRTDAEPEAVRLLLRGEVEEPLSVVPDAISALNADPSQPVVLRLHVRRLDGGPVALKAATTPSGRIQLKPLGESPNGAQVVRVVVAVPAWPEELRSQVVLETDFPGEAGRLEVPVSVRARPPR